MQIVPLWFGIENLLDMDTMDADGGILAGKLREDDTPTRNLILCVDEAICDI